MSRSARQPGKPRRRRKLDKKGAKPVLIQQQKDRKPTYRHVRKLAYRNPVIFICTVRGGVLLKQRFITAGTVIAVLLLFFGTAILAAARWGPA